MAEGTMDLSRDRLILELEQNYRQSYILLILMFTVLDSRREDKGSELNSNITRIYYTLTFLINHILICYYLPEYLNLLHFQRIY
jgi:hypothetical protein